VSLSEYERLHDVIEAERKNVKDGFNTLTRTRKTKHQSRRFTDHCNLPLSRYTTNPGTL
jgi:hypothetical protein